MTIKLKYIVYKEGNYYVSQSLNVEVSSFGDTVEESVKNLNEAVSLYFEDNKAYSKIEEVMIGESTINV